MRICKIQQLRSEMRLISSDGKVIKKINCYPDELYGTRSIQEQLIDAAQALNYDRVYLSTIDGYMNLQGDIKHEY